MHVIGAPPREAVPRFQLLARRPFHSAERLIQEKTGERDAALRNTT